MGTHAFKLNKVPCLLQKASEYQCFEVCFPETSSCDTKTILLRCKLVKPQCLIQVSLGLKEVQIDAHDFILNIVPLFRSQTCEYQCFEACCPRTSACASKPLLLQCKLAIPVLQCMCQVSLGLKEVQMGTLDFKLKKVHPFAERPVNINVLRSSAPKLALVPASRYNCHIK